MGCCVATSCCRAYCGLYNVFLSKYISLLTNKLIQGYEAHIPTVCVTGVKNNVLGMISFFTMNKWMTRVMKVEFSFATYMSIAC